MSPDQVEKDALGNIGRSQSAENGQLGAEVIVGWYKIPPIDGIAVTTSGRFSEFELIATPRHLE